MVVKAIHSLIIWTQNDDDDDYDDDYDDHHHHPFQYYGY
jgi:hypothetical protein